MFRLETGVSRHKKSGAVRRIDRRSIVQFHAGLRDPSLWLISPRSLFHQASPGPTERLTEFGKQIRHLIHSAAFYRIKYGTEDQHVVRATTALYSNTSNGRNRLVWKKTAAFTPLETTRHLVDDDSLTPCHEMLAQCIGQEVPSLDQKQSCLILVSNTVMEDLFNEQGGQPEHYVYDIIMTFGPRTKWKDECEDSDANAYI